MRTAQVLLRAMDRLAWSDGTKPVRSPASARPPPPGAEEVCEHPPDPIELALESRAPLRPEETTASSSIDRDLANARLSGRAPVHAKAANPFLSGAGYLDSIALQDAFLRPKTQVHAPRTEST